MGRQVRTVTKFCLAAFASLILLGLVGCASGGPPSNSDIKAVADDIKKQNPPGKGDMVPKADYDRLMAGARGGGKH